jgi:hypothetical protein
MANKHAPSKGPPTPYYKHEPQSVPQSTNYKLYCDKAKITDQTIHNNKPDTVPFDRSIKKAYSTDVAIPNSHNLHSSITDMLLKYADLKEDIIIWKLKEINGIYSTISTADTGTTANK